MATAEVPRSKKTKEPEPNPPGKRKSRSFRYAALLTLAALAGGAFCAPYIVANTPIRDWVLRSALDLDGSVSVGSLSLGWFSSIEIQNLELRDSENEVLLSVDAVRTDKPLVGYLLDSSNLGHVHVERPTVHVVAFEKDTNLEQAFRSLLTGREGARASAELEVTEGTIVIDDVFAKRTFQIDNLALTCAMSQVNETATLSATGTSSGGAQPGTFKIDVETRGSAQNETALANGKVDCQLSGLPLEIAQPLVRRFVERGQLAGQLSARLGGAWGDRAESGGDTSVSGEVLATGVVFSAAALGEDRIELDRLEMPCRIVQDDDLVRIEQLAATSSLGSLTLSGSVKMSDLSAENRLAALAHENYELKGQVDLAPLARMLPNTLRLRTGTEVTEGQVALVLSSHQQKDGTTWTGHIDASHLHARESGRNLTWEKPLSIAFTTHDTEAGLVVDKLDCASDFLQVQAAGSIDDLSGTASFDLAQLMTQLRQFSDLNQVQLAGKGQAQLAWKRTGDDQFAADAVFQARGFQLLAPHHRPWKEDNIVAKLDISGQLAERKITRVDRADLSVTAGTERLDAKLVEAITEPDKIAWPLECTWRGQLASWTPRLESCLGLTGWDFAGGGSVQATLNCSAKAIDIQQAKAQFDQFQVHGGGLFITEPTVAATVAGRCDLEKSRLDISKGKFVAGTTTATATQATVRWTDAGMALDGGEAQVSADLANLYRWTHDPRISPAWRVSGKLTGDAQLKYAAGVLSAQVGGAIDELQLAELARPVNGGAAAVWHEKRITVTAEGSYSTEKEQLQLAKLDIASNALHCDATGTVAMAAQGGDVDLKGTVQYDWAQLAPLWQPYVGQGVMVAGRQTRPFAVRGHLSGTPLNGDSWRDVKGEATLGWTGMSVDGLAVGPAEIHAQLADGQIRMPPLDVLVSEGHLTVRPLVRLSPAPGDVLIGGGPLLTNVHLSPELCAQGVKFLAPILADTTVADGRFSIVMDGARIPLNNPRAADASGRMSLKAQARPGPLAEQFTFLLNELTTILKQGIPLKPKEAGALLSIDDSNIEFRVVNGRIYHQNLTFMAGTTPITTRGSVGFDETVSMVAEVPISAKLLGIDLSLGTLEGTTMQIPIEGTLEKPLLDPHIVQQFAGKLIQSTTKGVLINEVNKTLEKLFPGNP